MRYILPSLRYLIPLALMAVALYLTGWREVGQALVVISWWQWGVALLCLLLFEAVQAFRLYRWLHAVGLPYPWAVAREYYREQQVTRLQGYPYHFDELHEHPIMFLRAQLLDRSSDLTTVLLMLVVITPASDFLPNIPLATMILPLMAFGLLWIYFSTMRRIGAGTIGPNWLGHGVAVSLLAHVAAIAALIVLAQGLLDVGRWPEAAVAYLISTIAVTLPLAFAGLGLREMIFFAAGGVVAGMNTPALVALAVGLSILQLVAKLIAGYAARRKSI